MSFVHLHFHTSYSFLDGYNPVKKAVARVKELGMKACAITDHNHLGGCVEFQEECQNNGIKPLLGYEGYYTEDMKQLTEGAAARRQDATIRAIEAGVLPDDEVYITKKLSKKELNEITDPYMYDTRQHHILFIAKNLTGWRNIVKIQSVASEDGQFNGRFVCDMDLIRKHHEGVICTTACISSYPARYYEAGEKDKAEKYIADMKDIFGDDFYLEIQPLNIDKQRNTNLFYLTMADKYDIEVIATNDVHYTLKSDHDDHDTLVCVGTSAVKWQKDRMHYSNDFWIKSEEEMRESFEEQTYSVKEDFGADLPEGLEEHYSERWQAALANTQKVADKVEENIPLGADHPLFSNVKVPKGLSPEQFLAMLAWKGLYGYLAKHPELDRQQYAARLAYELNVINPKGFAPYMLAVYEYVNYSNNMNWHTGPGRGSAAGSLVLFSIGVTRNIDPIKYDLLFSRFLTADRRDPPDIDIDFPWSHRDDLIKHLEDYYGIRYVAHIGTYLTMGVKSGLKDICRALGVSYIESDRICKTIDLISDDPGLTFKDFDEMEHGEKNEQDGWKKFHELELKYPEPFRLARIFQQMPRGFGKHASGVLVTPMPVSDVVPIRYDKTGTAITLYTGPQLEHFNFIKYDILGLKTLDIIQKSIDFIPTVENYDDLYGQCAMDDKRIWEAIAAKKTDNIFQIESPLMKGVIEAVKPSRFEDLIAVNSLGRPGPMGCGMHEDYGKRKSGEQPISYPISGCDELMEETYGTIPYQEILMAISKKIAGFDDMQADSLTRKTIAKKKEEMMPMLIRCHIFGKLNCEGPEGWEDDMHAPWYDPKGKYGGEIEGAIKRGYTEAEVLDYFHTIEKFSSYCFNKSHAACYAYIGLLTAWLKIYFPVQFMAGVLSMTAPDKMQKKIDSARSMGINLAVPNINVSRKDFTPDDEHNQILYGLGAVKGVGDASIQEIIDNAPYTGIEDAFKRLPKKAFNKRVAEGLIMAGAFDWENPNRITLLNQLHALRKDKVKNEENKNVLLVEDDTEWSEKKCMKFEEKTLGIHVTYRNWWEELQEKETAQFIGHIVSVKEHRQKNGKTMAFVTLKDEEIDTEIECCVFAKQYKSLAGMLYQREGHYLNVNGKKSEKGSFIINDATPAKAPEEQVEEINIAV